jgi:hypothetical protein
MKTKLHHLIREKSDAIFSKVVGYREHMHMYPELSYQEFETMKYVSSILNKLNIQHTTGIGDTGIVAIIKADHHTDEMHCQFWKKMKLFVNPKMRELCMLAVMTFTLPFY